ncbi:MAG: hypothetical protein AB8E15_10745 [Bdellovibrionales bacterium]
MSFIVVFSLLFHINLQGNELIIWNVGQGSMNTYIDEKSCLHFDMGGDFMEYKKVIKKCSKKKNYLWISHGDKDHISFINFFKRHLDICETCELPTFVEEIYYNPKAKKRNNRSRVFLIENRVLLPGDSEKKSEKTWSKKIKSKWFKVLILAHHGSNSSSSMSFIKKIKNPHAMAIASARKSKYNHPHPKVLQRLRVQKKPVLSTEDWGNIIIQF